MSDFDEPPESTQDTGPQAVEIARQGEQTLMVLESGSGTDASYCSFCGKAPEEYDEAVQGPGVRICNECVELCNQILKERKEEGT